MSDADRGLGVEMDVGLGQAAHSRLGAYTVRCYACPWHQVWSTPAASAAAGVWHVYKQHPDTWADIIGDRPPEDPRRPEDLGRPLVL